EFPVSVHRGAAAVAMHQTAIGLDPTALWISAFHDSHINGHRRPARFRIAYDGQVIHYLDLDRVRHLYRREIPWEPRLPFARNDSEQREIVPARCKKDAQAIPSHARSTAALAREPEKQLVVKCVRIILLDDVEIGCDSSVFPHENRRASGPKLLARLTRTAYKNH